MKRIFIIFLSLSIMCLFGGCAHTDNLKTINIITSCGVVTGDATNEFMFCISDASSSDDEKKTEKSYSLYRFHATDLSDAINQLKKTVGVVDFGHFQVLISDSGYVNKGLYRDVEYMSTQIKINPMMKYFVCSGNVEETLSSINSQYGKGADDFLEKVYKGYDKNVLCTLAEILFSAENKIFTTLVPAISADDNGLVCENGILLCTVDKGVEFLNGNDYTLFRQFIKKYGKNSKKLDIEITDGMVKIKIKPLDTSEETKLITDLAQRYKTMNYDILNCVYYLKKQFPTYTSYMNFIKYFSTNKLNFE